MRSKPTIVLAGSWAEFYNYIREQGAESPNDRRFVFCTPNDPLRISGIEASDVIEIGSFREHRNAQDVRQFAEARVR